MNIYKITGEFETESYESRIEKKYFGLAGKISFLYNKAIEKEGIAIVDIYKRVGPSFLHKEEIVVTRAKKENEALKKIRKKGIDLKELDEIKVTGWDNSVFKEEGLFRWS